MAKFKRPFRPVTSGPPPPAKIIEESLPEPQMIKQTWLGIFFEASRQLAEIHSLKRNKTYKPKLENAFRQNVESLFTMMAMKDPLKKQDGYASFRHAIMFGDKVDFSELVLWLFRMGEALQELGPLKIEYLRSVAPEDAWREGEILGEDY